MKEDYKYLHDFPKEIYDLLRLDVVWRHKEYNANRKDGDTKKPLMYYDNLTRAIGMYLSPYVSKKIGIKVKSTLSNIYLIPAGSENMEWKLSPLECEYTLYLNLSPNIYKLWFADETPQEDFGNIKIAEGDGHCPADGDAFIFRASERLHTWNTAPNYLARIALFNFVPKDSILKSHISRLKLPTQERRLGQAIF